MIPRPPTSTLFPYTTLFRSCWEERGTLRSRTCECSRWFAAGSRPSALRDHTGWGLPAGWCGAEYIGSRRSEEHTSELQSHVNLVCRLLLEKKKKKKKKQCHEYRKQPPQSHLGLTARRRRLCLFATRR